MYQLFLFDDDKISTKLVFNNISNENELGCFGPLELEFYPYKLIAKSSTKMIFEHSNFSNILNIEINLLIVDEERKNSFLNNMSTSYAFVILKELISRINECFLQLSWQLMEIEKCENDYLKLYLKIPISSCQTLFSQTLIFKAIFQSLLHSRGLLIGDINLVNSNHTPGFIKSTLLKILKFDL